MPIPTYQELMLPVLRVASLMIRYNVGCRTEETIQIKRLDEDFFE